VIKLDFSLDADNLALLAEGARGELHAKGKIGGTSDAPVIKFTAHGTGLEHGDMSVDKLDANIDLDWRGERTSHVDIAVSTLKVDQRELTQFNATLDGTTTDHSLKVDALAAKTGMHLSGRGAFVDGVWNATIGNLFIDDTANLNMQLDTPFKVMASAKASKIEPMCLHGKIARLCGEGGWGEGAWHAKADAHDLPISALTAGLTPKVEYEGTVNATASASSTGGAAFIGGAGVADAAPAQLASGRTDVINFGSGFATLKADPNQVNAELRLDAARGLISGRVRADRNTADISIGQFTANCKWRR
jgi:translocation and assembly module TamB